MTDDPRLSDPEDRFYDGCGVDWSVDLDGKAYKLIKVGKPKVNDVKPLIQRSMLGKTKQRHRDCESREMDSASVAAVGIFLTGYNGD